MADVLSTRNMPSAGTRSPKPVVFVAGSSGLVGKATVNALSINYGSKLDIRAGVRKPDSISDLKHLTGVTIVQAVMGEREALADVFKGVNVLLIVTPSTENRAELTQKTAEAAKDAGVSHIVVIGALGVELKIGVLSKPFLELEQGILGLGVSCTILRLPYFMENYFGYASTIKSDSALYGAADPNKQFQIVCMEDAGAAAAAILANPEKHAGKIYSLVSDRNTFKEAADALTQALGREIAYVRVPYEDMKKSLAQMGQPEWRVQLYECFNKAVDSGAYEALEKNEHFKEITGKSPTKLLTWMNRFVGAFK